LSNSDFHEPIGKIVRGSAWLTGCASLSKVLFLVFFVFLANRLGKENLGRFQFLLDSAFILFTFVDLGLGLLLVLKVSRRREATGELFARFLGLRIVMVLPFALLYGLFLYFYGRGTDWRMAQLLAVSYLIILSFWDILRSVPRGWERMDWEAQSTLLERLVYMGMGTLLLLSGFRLTGMMAVAQMSILCSLALIAFWVVRSGVAIRVRFEPGGWGPLLRETLPFGLGSLCLIALYKEDTVMLNWLRGDAETGIYSAGFRLMEGTLLVPQAVALAAYPTFSRLFHEGHPVRPLGEKLQRWLLILCLPLTIGGILLAPNILGFFRAEYVDSTLVLQLVLLGLPALYLNYLIGTVLRSVDRQVLNLKSAAVALATNFMLNLLLIPAYGAQGAAVATVITQCIYFAMMYFFLRRAVGSFRLGSYFPLLLGCSAILGGVVYLVRSEGLYVSVPLGMVVFAGLAFATRLVRREDVSEFLTFFRGR